MFQDMFLCPSKHVDKKRRRQQSSFLEFTNGIQGVFSMKKIKEPRMINDSSIIWYVPTYLYICPEQMFLVQYSVNIPFIIELHSM